MDFQKDGARDYHKNNRRLRHYSAGTPNDRTHRNGRVYWIRHCKNGPLRPFRVAGPWLQPSSAGQRRARGIRKWAASTDARKSLDDGTLIETGPYWIKYYRNGRAFCESAETESKTEANTLLRQKEGDVARGLPVAPKATRILVDELLEDLKNDYRVNKRKTVNDLEGRCKNHI